MKHLLTTLLLLATLSGGAQVATTKNVDSILLASYNTAQANSALAKLTYYSPSSLAQAQQIVANVTAYIQSQVAGVTWGTAPVVVVPANTQPKYIAASQVNWNGVTNKVITNDSIPSGSTACITLTNCSFITIQNNKLCNGSGLNSAGIKLINCHDITITNNFITNVSRGINVMSCTGNISVFANQFLNMVGPKPSGQFLQFNQCNGSGFIFTDNKCQNVLGKSNPEDAVSCYISNGTALSPITISNNIIQGGGPSATGGGCMTGDSQGSYQFVTGNILIDPGQYGISCSGGVNITLSNNIVYGKQQSFTNIGAYYSNYSGKTSTNIVFANNRVNFTNSKGANNGWWLGTNIGTYTLTNNNWNDPTVLPSLIPTPLITYK